MSDRATINHKVVQLLMEKLHTSLLEFFYIYIIAYHVSGCVGTHSYMYCRDSLPRPGFSGYYASCSCIIGALSPPAAFSTPVVPVAPSPPETAPQFPPGAELPDVPVATLPSPPVPMKEDEEMVTRL